ncbi:MAG: MaoC/PaaZ C-terminal domain-containing protein, partial [Pikeienuella sp.]
VVSARREIRLTDEDAPFATVDSTSFLRGDGGCGDAGKVARLGEPIPGRAPDREVTLPIRADAALIYRLSGDLNPLHIDPAYAARAGFDRPILHGLCTFAMAGRVIWGDLEQPSLLRRIGCRFSGVVFPGEALTVQVWEDAPARSFRAKVGERTVIDEGAAVIAES